MKEAVAGKGGVGQTTVSAFLARCWRELGYEVVAVDADLLRSLVALSDLDPTRPAACSYGEGFGIPVVLPQRLFPALLALSGDRGAKAILQQESPATLPFPGGLQDLDTPEDLARLSR